MNRNLLIIAMALIITLLISIVHSAPVIPTPGCQNNPSSITGVVKAISPWYCNTLSQPIYSVWKQWLPTMMVVISLSFSIAILLFLFGVVLKNDRLRTFGIGELYESFATTVIVGMFMFITAVMFGLLPAITAGPVNPYDAALSYIATTINATSVTTVNLFDIAAQASYYSTISLQTDAAGGEVRSPPVLAIAGFLISYYFFLPAWSIVVFLIEALISLYTQFYFIIFTMYSAVPVFLIPGILFRAFIPTRHLGGMLMAVAIAFYFVMPTLFALAYYFTSNSIASQLTLANAQIERYGANGNFVQFGTSPNAPLGIALQQVTSSFDAYWLSILFFPAMILAVTYSTIVQIAEMLGGMSKTSSRLRALV